MIICKIDGRECKNQLSLSIYLKKFNITFLDYHVKYEGFIIPKCVICSEECKRMEGLNFRQTCGNITCKNKLRKYIIDNSPNSSKNSEIVKSKIREARVNYLKKTRGNDSAWDRRSRGLMSRGEEKLHTIFEKNGIYEKYDVVNEYCESPYFIDFAFINERVAVEFDGKCHFSYGNKRIQHDIKKDEFLNTKGWRIYRVPFFEIDTFDLKNLINFIGDTIISNNFNTLIKYNNYLERCGTYCLCGKVKYHKSTLCQLCNSFKTRRVIRPSFEELINDVENLGYLGTGRKYGVSDNSIRKWIKFYKQTP